MKNKSLFMFYIAFVASLGGLLFGFDTAVLSGAVEKITEIYDLSPKMVGLTMAIALVGTVIGALFSAKPAERFGRLEILKIIAYLYFIGALGCALIIDWYALLFFRFLGGLAVGASSVVGPMYVAEMSPSHLRGRFVAFFQFNVVFGITLAYLSNFAIAEYIIKNPETNWQWMLGVMALPAALFAVLLFTVPESPRWLTKQGLTDRAKDVLSKIRHNVGDELQDIKDSLTHCEQKSIPLFQKKYTKPLLIAFFIATFNQFTGINAFLYYAPTIFKEAHAPEKMTLMLPILIGVVMIVFTMVGMLSVDKIGRKGLLFIGCAGMSISLAVASYGFFANIYYVYTFIALMIFTAFFTMSQGTVIWVIISEVFPTDVRAKGQTFGSMTHWAWNSVLVYALPVAFSYTNGASILFGIFAAMMLACFLYTFTLPNTNNKSLEQIQKELGC